MSKDIEIINESQIKARCLVVPFSNEIIHDKKFIENDDYFYYHFITKSIRTSNFNISESKSVFNQDAYNPEILNCNQKIKDNCEDLTWNPNNNLTDDMIDRYLGRIKIFGNIKEF